jgi:hypothetical protein
MEIVTVGAGAGVEELPPQPASTMNVAAIRPTGQRFESIAALL